MADSPSGTGRTKGRDATQGVIPGRYALSVGNPETPCPLGWQWTELSSVAQLESGHTPSRRHSEYWNGGVPWIGIKDATQNHGRTLTRTLQQVSDLGLQNSSARLLPANTVCLSRTASVGYVVKMGRSMATSQDFVNWVCGERLEPDFLKYVLLAEGKHLLRFASGTTHQTIYYPEAKAFHVMMPNLDEQRRIAEILGALDDKIELNRKMNQTLEEMAQAIFKSWFIDFDDHTEFVDSELGRIPKGWRVVPFAKAGKWVSGGTPSKNKAEYWGGALPWFSAKSLGPLWLASSEDSVTELGADNGSRRVPRRAVLFIVRGMSLAKEWRIGITTGDSTLNQDLKGIVDDGTTVPELLLLWLLVHREVIRAKADEAGHGTKRLPTEVLHTHALILPERSEQERIAKPLCALLQRIEVNQSETTTLTQLRDALLPKLISGEIRVPEARKAVESVA